MLCLNLIYDISFLLCHGLWSYIILSHLVTKRGQTGGVVQDQCSASFCPWCIFLWGGRPESETGCAWVIPTSRGLRCKASCKTIPGQVVGTTHPFIFHGNPSKNFASQYVVATVEATELFSRPVQWVWEGIKKKVACHMNDSVGVYLAALLLSVILLNTDIVQLLKKRSQHDIRNEYTEASPASNRQMSIFVTDRRTHWRIQMAK